MRRALKLTRKFITLVLALFLSLSLFMPLFSRPARAGDASLFFSPTSGIQNTGTAFSVSVRVHSGSYSTNAYRAVVTFPTDKLSATSISSQGSICTLWIPPAPAYSNTQGTATFECGHTSSFAGTSGTIGSITFLVRAAGTARLTFTSAASVKAADGAGTEVLGSTRTATFTLQPAPIGTPVISSSTHPDPNAWYAKKDIELNWTLPAGADGVSYTLNGRAETIPDDVSEGLKTQYSYFNNPDGVYYFHIKGRSTSGWGTTAHFRIQIDTTPPEPFQVTSEPSAENVTAAPLIGAAAIDRLSGIDHYELSFDGAVFATVKIPHKFETIPEGTHTVTVRAVDKAGNYRDGTLPLQVLDVAEPVIIRPADRSYLPIFADLIVRGGAPKGLLVELYLNEVFLTRVESDGTFEYLHTEFLHPGTHKLTAKVITANGIESSPAEVTFWVDVRAVSLFGFTLPGWLVYSTLLGIILTLLILLFRYLRKAAGFDEHVRKDVDQIEEEAEKDLTEAERELKQAVDDVLEKGDWSRVHQMEHELEKRIEEAEGRARERLEKELDRIRDHHPRRLGRFRLPKIRLPRIFFTPWKRRKKKEKE